MITEDVRLRTAKTVAPRWESGAGGADARTRIAAALGLLSVIVTFGGLFFHGYPAIGASGKEIVRWAATTDQRHFAIGVYIESLGGLLFLLFAAWLWSVSRDAEGGSGWLSTAGFSAAVLNLGASLMGNAVWWAVLDGGRHGTNAQTLASVRDIAQHAFDLTSPLHGVFLLLIGYVLVRTRTLPRPVGASAALIGVGILIPPITMGAYLFFFVWTVVVSVYLLARPSAVVTASTPSATVSTPTAVELP